MAVSRSNSHDHWHCWWFSEYKKEKPSIFDGLSIWKIF